MNYLWDVPQQSQIYGPRLDKAAHKLGVPENTRPFCLTDAQAGAPLIRRDGKPVSFVAHVPLADRYQRVVVLSMGAIGTVSEQGRPLHSMEHISDVLMAPLGFLDGKPVFVGDDLEVHGQPSKAQPQSRDFDGCRWPAPAKAYPQTTLDDAALRTNWALAAGTNLTDALRDFANVVLRHAADSGIVVDKADFMRESRNLGRAERTLEHLGYTDCGGELWKPPLGKTPDERATAVATQVVEIMAHEMAKAQPGPGGMRLTDGEVASIEKSLVQWHLPAILASMKKPA